MEDSMTVSDSTTAGDEESLDEKDLPPNADVMDDSARDTLIGEGSSVETSETQQAPLRHHVTPRDLHDALDFSDSAGEISNSGSASDGEIPDSPPPPDGAVAPLVEDGELASDEGEAEPELEDGELIGGGIRGGVATAAEELEEGEVTDDEERGRTRAVCRFYGKGQCTWGSNCRFLHPGAPDRGLYTMFEPKPPPLPSLYQPIAVKTGLLGHAPPNFAPLVKLVEEPQGPPESSWERGLRHAKEILKQSAVRRETDADFEEKKMNLSLAQEDLDKENDYYGNGSPPTAPAPAPVPQPLLQQHSTGSGGARDFRRVREAPPRDPPPAPRGAGEMLREAPPLHVGGGEEHAQTQQQHRRRYAGGGAADAHAQQEWGTSRRWPPAEQMGHHRGRGGRPHLPSTASADTWHDPWMPEAAKRRRRRRSAANSYSSADSTRSSSTSTDSSDERKMRRKVAPPLGAGARQQQRHSPKPVRIAPPLAATAKDEYAPAQSGQRRGAGFAAAEGGRAMRYAPPQKEKGGPRPAAPPNSTAKRSWSSSRSRSSRTRSRSFSPPTNQQRRSWSRSRSRDTRRRSKFEQRRSSSRSSYSNSSRSSGSEQQGKKNKQQGKFQRQRRSSAAAQKVDSEPVVLARPIIKQEKQPAQGIKSKAHISLTLKSSAPAYRAANKTVLDKLADHMDADSSPDDDEEEEEPSSPIGSPGTASPAAPPPRESRTSKERREELLKQLKAVEEAIAKKRSKMV